MVYTDTDVGSASHTVHVAFCTTSYNMIVRHVLVSRKVSAYRIIYLNNVYVVTAYRKCDVGQVVQAQALSSTHKVIS